MKVRYTEDGYHDLANLPQELRDRIANKVEFYASQNDPTRFAKRLSGYDAYRFRVGNYRVIFEVSGDVLFVLAIVKRDDAYKGL